MTMGEWCEGEYIMNNYEIWNCTFTWVCIDSNKPEIWTWTFTCICANSIQTDQRGKIMGSIILSSDANTHMPSIRCQLSFMQHVMSSWWIDPLLDHIILNHAYFKTWKGDNYESTNTFELFWCPQIRYRQHEWSHIFSRNFNMKRQDHHVNI